MTTKSEVKTTADDVPVVHMWDCPMPQAGVVGAGFPVLDNARHATVYAATAEMGGYNHHPQLIWWAGRFHAMWSNHPHGEDGPGQRLLYAASPDAVEWSAPQELFPPAGPIKPSEEMGLSLTAFKWLVADGRLFALAGCHANIGFHSLDESSTADVRDAQHPSRLRHGYSSLARELRPDAEPGAVFALWDNLPDALAFPVIAADDPKVADMAAQLKDVHRSPAGLPSWDFEKRFEFPRAVEGHRLCEPTVYQTGDGEQLMLMRDCLYSHRMYVSRCSAEDGKWSPAQPTDIPDSPSLTTNVALADGAVLLIGNQMSPAFDNPAERRHYNRDPLTVAVSPDGWRFERAYALRCGVQQHRIPGVRGRGGGGQYPSAIVHDGRLFVLHSMGKEDIAVSSVPLLDLMS